MRIAGIDAGLGCTGVAIYDTTVKDFIVIEKIKSSIKKATPNTQRRIEAIVDRISALLFWNDVDVVVIEDIFVGKKKQLSAIIPAARLRGGIEQMVLAQGYSGLYVMTTSQMKKQISGKGNNGKEACHMAIKKRFKKSKLFQSEVGMTFISEGAKKNDDVSDACCIAYAYDQNPALAAFT